MTTMTLGAYKGRTYGSNIQGGTASMNSVWLPKPHETADAIHDYTLQAIEAFRRDVAAIRQDPRWNAYSDKGLAAYDMTMAIVRAAARRLGSQWQSNRRWFSHAKDYLEALERDWKKRLAEATSPAPYAAEAAVYDAEVRQAANLETSADELLRRFAEAIETGDQARAAAWHRNADLVQARARELAGGGEGQRGNRLDGRVRELANQARRVAYPKAEQAEAEIAKAQEARGSLGSLEHSKRLIFVTLQGEGLVPETMNGADFDPDAFFAGISEPAASSQALA